MPARGFDQPTPTSEKNSAHFSLRKKASTLPAAALRVSAAAAVLLGLGGEYGIAVAAMLRISHGAAGRGEDAPLSLSLLLSPSPSLSSSTSLPPSDT
jgi:hypothetical protein